MKIKESVIAGNYIREKLPIIILYLVEAVIFMGIAGLYGYDNAVTNMRYAFLLVMVLGIAATIWKYIPYRRKFLDLQEILSKDGVGSLDIPETNKITEKLYQEIIEQEEKSKSRLIYELDEKKQDMADYYTMWIHQIKTPIAAMKLLLNREEQENKRNAGEKQVIEELFKIEQYAEMALHYARLDSMSSDMLFKNCDICNIVKQAVKKYFVLFAGSGLSFELEDFEMTAVTDEKWLIFAIEQLLSNAIKYTPEGKIHIYGINKDGKKSKENVTHVVIADTGIGIGEEDLPRIFERGFTGYNGRMDKRSTGIGLYLCRQIMDKLSHSIEIKSVRGSGTRVVLGFDQEKPESREIG